MCVQSDIINNINIESGNKAQKIWIVTDCEAGVCLSIGLGLSGSGNKKERK